MMESFGNRLAKNLFADKTSKELRGFPNTLRRTSRRKLLYLHEAVELNDLRAPPGNRLKELKGRGETMKQPKNPFHPGEILLEEFLRPENITQVAFSKKLAWTKARLNELIKGKRRITADSALDSAKALKTSAKSWMIQVTYDLDRAEKQRQAA